MPVEVREKQIFNLMDTNGRRRDVLNALRIYLEALGEIREEFPDAAWSSYPESVAQFVFYQKAVERSADVLRQHGHYDRLLEKLGPRLPAFLARSQTWEQLGLSEQDRDELDVYVEARTRHYTSNLVKLGFTDEERRITEAGAAFARGATRRDELEAMLPIDDVNLIVLRQMLKLRIFSAPDEAGRRRFYAPAVMALLLLLQNRAMDGGTFLTVVQGLSPYLSPERQAFVLEHLGDPERIERLVWDENIRIPGDFLSDAPLTRDVFASHIRNQKSGRTVEIYYAFYQRLLAFREERSRAACEELLTLLREEKGILRKAFGCGRAVFAAGRGREPDLETFLRENGDHPLLCGEHFNREFYRAYERSSRADDIREYADTTERLLSAAGIWRFDPQSALAFPELLDELLDREALPVFGEMSDAEFRAWEGAGDCAFRRDLSLAQILRYEDGQTRAAVRRVEAAVGAAGAGEVRTLMRSKLSEDFRRHVEEKYPQEAVEKLLPLFSDRRNDGKIRKAVNDAASVPTIYEYIVGIAWYYLSGGDFDLYASLNLTLNADFEPVIHAGGGEGDIVIRYEDRVIQLEVTLMNKQAQKRGEWEPVLRHALNLKADSEPKEVFTFFIADELDRNTINIWRAVAAVSLESTRDHRQVDGAVIMPLTNGELLHLLRAGVSVDCVLPEVRASFAKVPRITDAGWKEEILDRLCP